MFENPRRDRQARNFTTNVPKILDRKSSFEHMKSPIKFTADRRANYLTVAFPFRVHGERVFQTCSVSKK